MRGFANHAGAYTRLRQRYRPHSTPTLARLRERASVRLATGRSQRRYIVTAGV